MKIMFLSWGEVPRLSSVYGGQLVNVVKNVGQHESVEDSYLVAGMPLIHSGLVREKWRYGKELSSIRNLLGSGNFFRRKLIVPPVGIYPTEAQIGMFKLGQTKSMIKWLRKRKPDILHCRSYLATYMAHEWRNASGLDFKILFDTRSYMPDEAIQRECWAEGSPDHQFWRKTEARLLRDSDAVNVVSEPMRTRFIGMGADPSRVHLIHLNVEAPEEEKVQGLGIVRDGNGPLFCYCGYLDYAGWHHPNNVWQLLDRLATLRNDARFLIITKSSHTMLAADLRNKGLDYLREKIVFTSAVSPSECVRIMQGCDAGLLSYYTPKSELEFEMARGVFATKTAEYLFAGIPVLVNKICGGAAEFVEEHNVGVSYDSPESLNDSDISRLLGHKSNGNRLQALAKEKFDIEHNSRRLCSIYSDMLRRS